MKTVYTITPDVAFADALAEGIVAETGKDPLALTSYIVLLPTRRACQHLREAFRRCMKGHAALLPRMRPIGEPDEDEFYFAADAEFDADIPPAIAPLRRQLLLARLVRHKEPDMPLDQAVILAEALARLLDEVQNEQRDFSGLPDLVAERELAEHWQLTVRFLSILTEEWPKILAEEGCIDPADRRNRVLKTQAEAWRKNPPKERIIAAGSTGSMPATADLLDVIAALPQGAVILPGLDTALPSDAWQQIAETHPQYGMKALLEKCGVERAEVKLWNNAAGPRPGRMRLLNEAMRPAEVSAEWRNLDRADIPPDALSGLSRLTLDHPQEEARTIALILRHALETPTKTAMLVTPARALAERVGTLLERWGIRVNDSGGSALSSRPVGSFLLDLLAAAAPDAAPVDTLALLKHPMAACGWNPLECRNSARHIEINLWRDPRPDEARRTESKKVLQNIRQLLQPLSENWHRPLPLTERIAQHRKVAEGIAATDTDSGAARLWRGEDGEAAAIWLDDWSSAAHGFPPITGPEYRELFASLCRAVKVRPAWGLHPRLSILGPLEARLIHADLVILGGLNEGIWPPEAQADPWMSRPMKKNFGLPLPERRIGLSAHDFVQLASARETVVTRAARMEGAPSVPSRFVLQLETVLRALGYSDDKKDALAVEVPWQVWARMLDEPPAGDIKPCAHPEPRPPTAYRPRELSVTEIGLWQRNPYAIYARHILDLRKLEPLEIEPDAAERGTIIHAALEAFVRQYPKNLPPDALDQLLAAGREVFASYAEHPEVRAFWWPRFERIAAWFIAAEHERRDRGIEVLEGEAKGHVALGDFTLKGRADRMEKLPDGTLGIADYKTGGIPSQAEVAAGHEPQLPLLALIAQEGGFKGVGAAKVSELAYWQLNGGRQDSEIRSAAKASPETLIQNAREGLESLIAAFADPAMPYRAVPRPDLEPRYDDYAHLARLREWGRTGEDT